jgi:O-antigen ligase
LVVAVTAVSSYALATRLIPDHFGAYDPVATYRLSEPVGYWNGLGVFIVMGILLAFGVAADRGSQFAPRAIAAAALVLLPVTLFFTYSRGSWIALGLGAGIAVIASPHRLRLLAVAPWVAVLPAVAIAVAAHSKALTHQNAPPGAIEHQGHRLYLILLVFAALGALATVILVRLEHRIHLAPRDSRIVGALLLAAVVCGAVAIVVRAGGPIEFVQHGYDSFSAAAPSTEKTDLNERLLSLNGNGRAQLWRVALNAARGHWLGGTGAGSFARQWEHSPTANFSVRDAHGLYVETISELGVIGLLLLVGALMVPVVAGVAARRKAGVPAVLGAYGAFVFHNGIDWDWELSGVALSGLLVGSLLLVARREGTERHIGVPVRTAGLVAVAAAALLALVSAIGNGALARAQTANERERYTSAESDATLARRWMPWSTEPLLALGEAQLGRGDVSGAAGSFRKAISIDRRDWQAWLDLAAVTHGAARKHAVGVARGLYPTSPEILEFEREATK